MPRRLRIEYSPAELMAMEKTLAQKADASGLATETLKKYATDYTHAGVSQSRAERLSCMRSLPTFMLWSMARRRWCPAGKW